MTILYIGPIKREQDEIAAVLNRAGYHNVAVSSTIEDAYQRLGMNSRDQELSVFGIDLVVLDIMSENSHLNFLSKLMENFQYRDVPVVVISDSSTPKFVQMAFAFGATDFIVKPVVEEELVARVRSSLRLKHEIDRRKAREKELTEVTRQLSDINTWLTRVSLIDSLTQIANRRGFDTALEQEWRRAVRNESSLSLVMLDVDFFKQYNDNYGHRMGDECLREVAAEIKRILRRPGDTSARYGGEEFALILAETDQDGAKIVAETTRKAIEDLKLPHSHSKVSPFVTVSAGIATIQPCKKHTIEQLITSADEALYKAKKSGRNSVASSGSGTKKKVG